MTQRMKGWKTFFRVLGVIVIVLGFVGNGSGFSIISGIFSGIMFFFLAAVMDWMDGVLDHLSGMQDRLGRIDRESQEREERLVPKCETWMCDIHNDLRDVNENLRRIFGNSSIEAVIAEPREKNARRAEDQNQCVCTQIKMECESTERDHPTTENRENKPQTGKQIVDAFLKEPEQEKKSLLSNYRGGE